MYFLYVFYFNNRLSVGWLVGWLVSWEWAHLQNTYRLCPTFIDLTLYIRGLGMVVEEGEVDRG